MMLLPKTIGPVTLQRKLGTSSVTESYQGLLGPEKRKVLVRRVLPFIVSQPSKLLGLEARVRDLMAVQHPLIVPILDWVIVGQERLVVEEWVQGCDLERVMAWSRAQGQPVPPNVYLNLATQFCSALEVLHGRPGRSTGAENTLHLGLQPSHLFVTPQARVVLGGFALTRSPTANSQGGVGSPIPQRLEYLSPEQTHPDQQLTCSSDVFSLATILFEFMAQRPLFKADSSLQTIHLVRAAQVSGDLALVKDRMPGLDKVLARALSENPSHRFRRAFVLREELRGLMAAYDFSNIVADTQRFLDPISKGQRPSEGVRTQPKTTAAHVAAAERLAKKAGIEREQRAARERQAIARAERDPAAEPAAPGYPPGVDSAEGFGPSSPAPLSDPATDLEGARPPSPARPRQAQAPAIVPFHPIPGGFGAAPDAYPTLLPEAPALEPSEQTASSEDTTNVGFVPESKPTPRLPSSSPPIEFTQAEPAPATREALAPTPGVPSVRVAPAPRIAQPFEEEEEILETLESSEMDKDDEAESLAFASGLDFDTETQALPAPLPVETAPPSQPPPVLAAPSIAPPPPLAAPSAGAAPPPGAPPPVPPTLQTIKPKSPPAAPKAESPPPKAAPPKEKKKKRSVLGIVLAVAAALLLFSCLGVAGTFFYLSQRASQGIAELNAGLEELAATEATPIEHVPEAAVLTEAAAGPVATAGPEQQPPEPVTPAEPTPEPVREPVAQPAGTPKPAGPPTRTEPTPRPVVASVSSQEGGRSTAPREPRPDPVPAAREVGPSYDPLAELEDSGGPVGETDLDPFADDARRGRLSSSDVRELEQVVSADPAYTRSRALLLMNAEKNDDSRQVKQYIDELMVLPENKYNSVYLSKEAAWYANQRMYADALSTAKKAERYWARIPPELVFGTKADIYETKAAAYQGLFYASQDDLELLDQAVSSWQTYKRHVSTRGSAAEAQRADAQIAKLEDIRNRLE